MTLLDVINRTPVPIPWEEGDNIPWDDPEFSRRMLQEHLNQAHDAASRRFDKIDKQVGWIHNAILGGRPTRILDLGCGPGLYTSRLSRLGHECVGIDYSPASIEYGKEQASREGLTCTYIHDDIRAAEYGNDYGLVMLCYGEFNVFSPLDARAIVRKVSHALASDGVFLLEPHTFTAIQKMGQRGRSWYTANRGVFSDRPHLCLQEHVWDEVSRTATIRYFIVDAAGRQVTAYAQTLQAYATEEYETMLRQRGLEDIQFYPSLIGVKDSSQDGFFVIAAREGAEAT